MTTKMKLRLEQFLTLPEPEPAIEIYSPSQPIRPVDDRTIKPTSARRMSQWCDWRLFGRRGRVRAWTRRLRAEGAREREAKVGRDLQDVYYDAC